MEEEKQDCWIEKERLEEALHNLGAMNAGLHSVATDLQNLLESDDLPTPVDISETITRIMEACDLLSAAEMDGRAKVVAFEQWLISSTEENHG